MVDPDPGRRYIEAGTRMQELGKKIGLGLLSVAFALVVLAVFASFIYAVLFG